MYYSENSTVKSSSTWKLVNNIITSSTTIHASITMKPLSEFSTLTLPVDVRSPSVTIRLFRKIFAFLPLPGIDGKWFFRRDLERRHLIRFFFGGGGGIWGVKETLKAVSRNWFETFTFLAHERLRYQEYYVVYINLRPGFWWLNELHILNLTFSFFSVIVTSSRIRASISWRNFIIPRTINPQTRISTFRIN